MPAVSEKQRRFMGAELARKRAGKKTRTGMNEQQLREFSHKKGTGGGGGSPVKFVKREGSLEGALKTDQATGSLA